MCCSRYDRWTNTTGPPIEQEDIIYISGNVLVLLCIHTKVHHSPYPIQNRTEQTPLTNLGKYLFWLLPLPLDSFIRCGWRGSGWLGCWWMTLLVQILWRGFCFALPKLCWIFEVGWWWWVWHTCIRWNEYVYLFIWVFEEQRADSTMAELSYLGNGALELKRYSTNI